MSVRRLTVTSRKNNINGYSLGSVFQKLKNNYYKGAIGMKKALFAILLLVSFFIACSDGGVNTGVGIGQLATPGNITSKVVIDRSNVESIQNVNVTVTWNPVPYADHYNVYVSKDNGKTQEFLGRVTTFPKEKYMSDSYVNTFTDTFEYEEDTTYYYYVNACVVDQMDDNTSQGTPTLIDSNYASVAARITYSTDLDKTIVMSTVSATKGLYTDRVVVSWNKVHDPADCAAASYRVYRTDFNHCGVDTGYVQLTGTITTSLANENVLEYIDTTIPTGTTTSPKWSVYRIVAYNGTKESEYSNKVVGFTSSEVEWTYKILNPAVIGVEGSLNTNNIPIRWEKVNREMADASLNVYVPATSYDIYRSEVSNTAGFALVTDGIGIAGSNSSVVNQLTFTDDSITFEKGKNYYYRVVAKTTYKGINLESDIASISSQVLTAYVTGMSTTSVSVSQEGFIYWTDVDNVASYDLRYITRATYDGWVTAGTLNNITAVIAGSTDIDETGLTAEELNFTWTALPGAGTYKVILIITGANGQQSVSYSNDLTRS